MLREELRESFSLAHPPRHSRACDCLFSPRLRICGHVTAITMDTFLCTQVCTSCERALKELMEAVWRVLYVSFKGVLTVEGDKLCGHHAAGSATHASSSRRDDSHNRSFCLSKYKKAKRTKILGEEFKGHNRRVHYHQ